MNNHKKTLQFKGLGRHFGGNRIMKTRQDQMKSQFLPALAVAAAILTSATTGVVAADAPPNRTLGFVVKDWMPAVYETKFIDECPAGLNISNDEIWWRSLSKEERSEKTQDGLITTLDRWFVSKNRGPNGEDVCIKPGSD